MTLQAAVDELTANLTSITGLDEHSDLRDETLLEASLANIDGDFLMRVGPGGNPWPELAAGTSGTPTAWWVPISLEVATHVEQDLQTSEILAAERARLVREKLHYTQLTNGQVWDMEDPTNEGDLDGDIIVWVWRFKLRYQE